MARSVVSSYYDEIISRSAQLARGGTASRSPPVSVAVGRRESLCLRDFEVIAKLDGGSLSEVFLCRQLRTDFGGTPGSSPPPVVVKCMRKEELLRRNLLLRVHNERLAATTARSPFVSRLHGAFVDGEMACLILEFCGGGDLLTWLVRLDTFAEPAAAFYTAELAAALHALHGARAAGRDHPGGQPAAQGGAEPLARRVRGRFAPAG